MNNNNNIVEFGRTILRGSGHIVKWLWSELLGELIGGLIEAIFIVLF